MCQSCKEVKNEIAEKVQRLRSLQDEYLQVQFDIDDAQENNTLTESLLQKFHKVQEQYHTILEEINKTKYRFKHNIVKKGTFAHCPICEFPYLGWYCPDSEDNLCHYDNDEDPYHDCCIYCGQPEERK